MVIQLSELARFKKQGAQLKKSKLSEPDMKSKRETKLNQELQNEQTLATKMIRTIACLNSEIELLKSNVSCDSCVGMLAKNKKLKLDYSTCVEQLEIARAEIIEINSMHSSTCSSTLNNDTCIDSNDNHDVLFDINACNVSTISGASCIDLKHKIDDFK
jgi:hypothetical protein